MCFLGSIGINVVIGHQSGERLAGEVALVPQVAVNDQVASRMGREPVLSLCQQLLQFVLTDPVMLVVVQNRQQDIQVCEEILQTVGGVESD